jgi:hypothetical protein
MSLRFMLKNLLESNMGRIRWSRNMWAIIGCRWDRRRLRNPNLIGKRSDLVNEFGEWEKDGKTLVERLHTQCPKPPADDFVRNDRGWYYVPATECRACPLHIKAGNRIRFPRCGYKFEDDASAAMKTAKDVSNIINDVNQKIGDILG